MGEPHPLIGVIQGVLSKQRGDLGELLKIALVWDQIAPKGTYPYKLSNGVLKVRAEGFQPYIQLSTSLNQVIRWLKLKGFNVEMISVNYLPLPTELNEGDAPLEDEDLDEVTEELSRELASSEGLDDEILSDPSVRTLVRFVAKATLREGNRCKFCGRPSSTTPCPSCEVKIRDIKRRKVLELLERKPWADYDMMSSETLREFVDFNVDTSGESDLASEGDTPLILEALLTLSRDDFEEARQELLSSLKSRLIALSKKGRRALREALPLLRRYAQTLTRRRSPSPKIIEALASELGFTKRRYNPKPENLYIEVVGGDGSGELTGEVSEEED